MKANTLFGVAVLALGALSWLWTRDGAWSGQPGPAARPDDSRAAAAHRGAPSPTPTRVYDREAIDPATTPTGALPPDVLDAVRLEILDADGAPAADAEVFYLPPMPPEAVAAAATAEVGDEPERAGRRRSRVARPDANGFVDLLIEPDSVVTAWLDDTYAQAEPAPQPPGMPRQRMVLRPDVTLHVQVVDRSGAPIPDVDLFATSEGRSRRRGVFAYDAQLGPTDAEGMVQVRHLQERLELPQPGAKGRLRLRLGNRWSSRREAFEDHFFAADQLHGDVTLRLVTDTAGTIAVRPLDADGDPIRAAARLDHETGEGYETRPTHRDGALWFSPVPTGRKWRLTTYIYNRPELASERVVTGPAVNGATTRLDVPLPLRQFRIAARVVDGTGVAVPHATVALQSPQAWELAPAEAAAMTTDDNGEISTGDLHMDAAAKTFDLTVTVTSPLTTPRTFVFRALAKGEHDLGDLAVARLPGQPLLAAVELRCDGKPPTGVCKVVLEQMEPHGEERWAKPVLAQLERDGAKFSFYGPLPEHAMRLVCWSTDGVRQVIDPVPPGARRVVDLVHDAELIVAIEPPDVPIDEIRGELTPLGADTSFNESVSADEQTLWWIGVPPGSYSLRLSIADRTLWSCASLELAAGVNRLPADGSRLDLRSLAEARLLQVFTAPEQELVHYEAIAIGRHELQLPPPDERLEVWQWFLLREPHDDLLLRAFEYMAVRVPEPADDVAVTLQRSVRLTLDQPDEYDRLHGRLLFDPIADPLLRAFDKYNEHAAEFDPEESDLLFVPGSVVEFCVERDGRRGTPVRVTVGAEAPPPVVVR